MIQKEMNQFETVGSTIVGFCKRVLVINFQCSHIRVLHIITWHREDNFNRGGGGGVRLFSMNYHNSGNNKIRLTREIPIKRANFCTLERDLENYKNYHKKL